MNRGDLTEVKELAAQLGYPVSTQEISDRFAEIQKLPGYALFVAESVEEKVIGYIQINFEPKTLLIGQKQILQPSLFVNLIAAKA